MTSPFFHGTFTEVGTWETPPEIWVGPFSRISWREILRASFEASKQSSLHGLLNGRPSPLTPPELDDLRNGETDSARLTKSLRVTNVQLLFPELRSLSRQHLERFGRAIFINAYFTPDSSTPALLYHGDPHQTAIYQLEGEKTWYFLKGDNGCLRARRERLIERNFLDHEKLKHLESSHHLRTGSWLEFPYSTYHRASNPHSTPSVHLTLSYREPTFGEMMGHLTAGLFGCPWPKEDSTEITEEMVLSILQKKPSYETLIQRYFEFFDTRERRELETGYTYES